MSCHSRATPRQIVRPTRLFNITRGQSGQMSTNKRVIDCYVRMDQCTHFDHCPSWVDQPIREVGAEQFWRAVECKKEHDGVTFAEHLVFGNVLLKPRGIQI